MYTLSLGDSAQPVVQRAESSKDNREWVINPTFSEEKNIKEKQPQLEGIKYDISDASKLASTYFSLFYRSVHVLYTGIEKKRHRISLPNYQFNVPKCTKTICVLVTRHWSYDPLVLQPIGPTAHWSYDPLVLRPFS